MAPVVRWPTRLSVVSHSKLRGRFTSDLIWNWLRGAFPVFSANRVVSVLDGPSLKEVRNHVYPPITVQNLVARHSVFEYPRNQRDTFYFQSNADNSLVLLS